MYLYLENLSSYYRALQYGHVSQVKISFFLFNFIVMGCLFSVSADDHYCVCLDSQPSCYLTTKMVQGKQQFPVEQLFEALLSRIQLETSAEVSIISYWIHNYKLYCVLLSGLLKLLENGWILQDMEFSKLSTLMCKELISKIMQENSPFGVCKIKFTKSILRKINLKLLEHPLI